MLLSSPRLISISVATCLWHVLFNGPQGRGYNINRVSLCPTQSCTLGGVATRLWRVLSITTPRKFGQRPPRLDQVFQRYDPPVFFVTFCTHKRKPLLGCAAVHSAFIEFANHALREFNIIVGRYVLMPDHVHLFVCGGDDFLLGRWIGGLKQALGRAIDRSTSQTQIWQEGFFDHLLRNDESMSQKWEIATCLWHVHPRRPTGPWLHQTETPGNKVPGVRKRKCRSRSTTLRAGSSCVGGGAIEPHPTTLCPLPASPMSRPRG